MKPLEGGVMAEQQGFVEGGPGISSSLQWDKLQVQWEKLQLQFGQQLGQLEQRFGLEAEQLTPVIVAFGILLLTSLLLLFWAVRTAVGGKKRDSILLLGLSGGGKTALYYQLRNGSTHKGTVTSMEPNEDRFILHSEAEQQKGKKIKPVHIVDVPGHPRLKPKIDEFLPQASGIVFVVDALDFMPQVRLTAEYLYDILTKAVVVRKKIPVLLACNKMDKVTAHSVDFIRRQLEKEIEKLRSTRKVTSDADVGTEIMIGSQTGLFELTQCVNKVSVCEISALHGKVGIVEQFIRENVKV